MLKFKGTRVQTAAYNPVIFTVDGETWANVPLYLEEVNHSPTGFEWGYWGSGPSQLAYAMLRVYFRVVLKDDTQDLARGLYAQFKFDIIGKLRKDEWEMDGSFITNWLQGVATFTSGSAVSKI